MNIDCYYFSDVSIFYLFFPFLQTHRFLFSSDVDRGEWKREIGAQQKNGKTCFSLGKTDVL